MRTYEGQDPIGGVEIMAMSQRDDTIEATRRSDGRWRLKSAAVWYDFTMSGKE